MSRAVAMSWRTRAASRSVRATVASVFPARGLRGPTPEPGAKALAHGLAPAASFLMAPSLRDQAQAIPEPPRAFSTSAPIPCVPRPSPRRERRTGRAGGQPAISSARSISGRHASGNASAAFAASAAVAADSMSTADEEGPTRSAIRYVGAESSGSVEGGRSLSGSPAGPPKKPERRAGCTVSTEGGRPGGGTAPSRASAPLTFASRTLGASLPASPPSNDTRASPSARLASLASG
jgi:hypothetical protein